MIAPVVGICFPFFVSHADILISALGSTGSKQKPGTKSPTGFVPRVSRYALFGRYGKHGKQTQARRFFQGGAPMIDPMMKYREALALFAAPGGRWANKGALTYWGRAAGLTADDLIADAHAAGVADRDADIRRGWEDARPKGEAVRGSYVPRAAKPKPPRFPPMSATFSPGLMPTRVRPIGCANSRRALIGWGNRPKRKPPRSSAPRSVLTSGCSCFAERARKAFPA